MKLIKRELTRFGVITENTRFIPHEASSRYWLTGFEFEPDGHELIGAKWYKTLLVLVINELQEELLSVDYREELEGIIT